MKLSTPHSVRLNLRLAPADAGFYRVELRAGDQVREATVAADTLPVAGVLDTLAYGRQLFTWLLGDTELKSMWQKLAIQFPARRSIFLQIDDRAPELNMVPWELLRDDDLVLAADEHTPFIRYVPVAVTAPRPAVDPLRVLVAIAAPQVEPDGGVEPINVDVERYLLGILQTHKRVQADLLGVDTPCTLANLDQALARGYHVLHLVSHGASDPARGTLLLLADADNRPRWVDEDTVAQMLRRHVGMGVDDPGADNVRPLRLITFAGCLTAQRSAHDPYRGLAAKLVRQGTPAVVAMRQWIQPWAAHQFFQTFYQELLRHGNIELACNRGRAHLPVTAASLSAAPGDDTAQFAALPVLYSHLRDSGLWHPVGFRNEADEDAGWTILLNNLHAGRCTPILGPDLNQGLLGSRREIARRWADEFAFPLTLHDRDDLTQVAQYLAVKGGQALPRTLLLDHLTTRLRNEYPDDVAALGDDASVDDLAVAVGLARMQRLRYEPYHVLAQLNANVFVNTNPTSLLPAVLVHAGKTPHTVYCPWNDSAQRLNQTDGAISGMWSQPTAAHPLVYYLFGHLATPRGYVLTEDDYFDFLIRINREDRSGARFFPPALLESLSNSCLLFLGFRLQDWAFRVLFRWLMTRDGFALLQNYKHVAVQINPDEDVHDVEQARQYLEEIFGSRGVTIYWGSAESFLRELGVRLGIAPLAAEAQVSPVVVAPVASVSA